MDQELNVSEFDGATPVDESVTKKDGKINIYEDKDFYRPKELKSDKFKQTKSYVVATNGDLPEKYEKYLLNLMEHMSRNGYVLRSTGDKPSQYSTDKTVDLINKQDDTFKRFVDFFYVIKKKAEEDGVTPVQSKVVLEDAYNYAIPFQKDIDSFRNLPAFVRLKIANTMHLFLGKTLTEVASHLFIYVEGGGTAVFKSDGNQINFDKSGYEIPRYIKIAKELGMSIVNVADFENDEKLEAFKSSIF